MTKCPGNDVFVVWNSYYESQNNNQRDIDNDVNGIIISEGNPQQEVVIGRNRDEQNTNPKVVFARDTYFVGWKSTSGGNLKIYGALLYTDGTIRNDGTYIFSSMMTNFDMGVDVGDNLALFVGESNEGVISVSIFRTDGSTTEPEEIMNGTLSQIIFDKKYFVVTSLENVQENGSGRIFADILNDDGSIINKVDFGEPGSNIDMSSMTVDATKFMK